MYCPVPRQPAVKPPRARRVHQVITPNTLKLVSLVPSGCVVIVNAAGVNFAAGYTRHKLY